MEPDPKTVEKARDRMRELLNRSSFAERWHPVMLELMSMMAGGLQPTKRRFLPEYCYEILQLIRRTVFKGLCGRRHW